MSKKPRGISEFLRDKRRAGCPVCKVPDELRVQMNAARQRAITIPNILEWLKVEHGIVLTREQMRHHYGGMHEGPAGMLNRG